MPAAADWLGVISVGRVAVALGEMAATRNGGLSERIGSVVRVSIAASGIVVRVDGTIASRRRAAARFGCAPTACGEVALGAGTLAEVGRTSAVLGEAPAALDTDVVVVSGVVAAGCPPVAVGVGGIVDAPSESTGGAGVAAASDDGVDTSGCGY